MTKSDGEPVVNFEGRFRVFFYIMGKLKNGRKPACMLSEE